ncbi:MAG: TonB-dependent receptor [Tannerella sp.]|nr:TonB-dependent receptor [Tannerella sp.]
MRVFNYFNTETSKRRRRKSNCFFILLLASVFSTVMAYADRGDGEGALPEISVSAPEEVSQQGGITGFVYDETGEPVAGAAIVIKGTKTGTVTDAEGRFTINVAAGMELEVSFIGYATQTVKAANNLRITLSEDTQQIEEVVVVGYGTVRKSDLTGSLVSISSEKFKNLPQGGVTQILQGKAAGVNITSTSGAGNTNIRIRGITSLNKSSEPLWVVDGVIGGTQGNFYDIQSIEVLKDASSTAIYGSQGANGVILVTTKKAQEGKAKVTFDARYGWKTMRKTPDLLSPYEWAQAYRYREGVNAISDADMAAYKSGAKGIDWIDMMTQTGFGQDYNLNISGGSNKTKYGITVWGGDARGQIITDKTRNYNVKASLDAELAPWLNLTGYLYGSHDTDHNHVGNGTTFYNILTYTPATELQAEDGTYIVPYNSEYGANPYADKHAKWGDGENSKMTGFADLRFKIIDGLSLSLQGFYTRGYHVGRSVTTSKLKPNQISEASNDWNHNYRWRNINNLTYQKDFGDHRLTAMGVFEATKAEFSNISISGNNIANEATGYWDLASTGTQKISYSNYGQTFPNGVPYYGEQMVSVFGRVIYSYQGKYSFTGTYRADAPSQFKNKNKWGYFPSAGVAWNASEEDFVNNFIDKDLIQQLKLRATVGTTGNHGVGAYATYATLSSDKSAASYGTNTLYVGYWPKSFPNPDLRWEKTTQYDLGLDLSVLDQKVNLSADWYLKKTTDLLFQKALPDYNGGGNVWTNQGALDNMGWEFTLNAFPVQTSGLRWESNLTATYTKTEIKDLGGEERIFPDADRGGANSGALFVLQVGKPIGTFYLNEWAGFDENGANLYVTKDGSKTTSYNAEDKKVLDKKSIPDWIFGWNNSLTYKNWDFNAFFRATSKYYRLNHSRFYQSCITGASPFISSREAYYLSWDHVADKSKAQFPSLTNTNSQYVPASTQWLENAAFLRLQNVTLGYQVPKKMAKIADIHLSFSIENAFVLSGYKGMDPETVSEVDDKRKDGSFGLDDGAFPIPRTYTFIVRFDF